METAIHRMVAAANDGTHDAVVAKMSSGWAVLGDVQVLRGYCLLLPDPVVPHLNELEGPQRTQFLEDMAKLGDAVLAVTGAAKINYALFGNLEPALHAHVFPRYEDEPDDLRTNTPWAYDWSQARKFDLDNDSALLTALREQLSRSVFGP